MANIVLPYQREMRMFPADHADVADYSDQKAKYRRNLREINLTPARCPRKSLFSQAPLVPGF
jgi:hypothetical protein